MTMSAMGWSGRDHRKADGHAPVRIHKLGHKHREPERIP